MTDEVTIRIGARCIDSIVAIDIGARAVISMDLCPCHYEPWYIRPSDGHRQCWVKKREARRRWSASNREKRIACLQEWKDRNPERMTETARHQRLRDRNRAIVRAEASARGDVCLDCNRGPFTGGPRWHWHHRIPSDKRATISMLVSTARSIAQLRAELQKCDLLCAPCHQARHRNA